MIEIPFAFGEIFLAVVWFGFRIFHWIMDRGIDWKKEAQLILMYLNLAVIIRFAFYPMALKNGAVQPLVFDFNSIYPFRINLLPFVNMFDHSISKEFLLDLVGNVMMFIPTGMIIPLIEKDMNSFWKVVGAGAVLALVIECCQLPFGSMTSDIDELLLHTAGVAIGYAIYTFIKIIKKTFVIFRDKNIKITAEV